jgi:hypothetical protein
MDIIFFLDSTIISQFKLILLYIDPGTGSLLFQILSAIALAILFFFTRLKMIVVKLFNKVKSIIIR